MAATNSAIAIYGERSMSGTTVATGTQVTNSINPEQGINTLNSRQIIFAIVLRLALPCVHPDVNIRRDCRPQGLDFREDFAFANNADRVSDPERIKFRAL